MNRSNLFEKIPSDLSGEEFVDVLSSGDGFRVERIVSRGHSSEAGFWYDQPEAEWVILVSGSAVLRFESEQEAVEMSPGDWIEIPAHCRHRVDSTADENSVWLAVHGQRPGN